MKILAMRLFSYLQPCHQLNTVLIFSKEDLNLISVNLHFIAARKHGLSEVSQEVYNLVSHATQERLRNILEKLSTISLHRLEVYRVCRTSLLKNSFFVFFFICINTTIDKTFSTDYLQTHDIMFY